MAFVIPTIYTAVDKQSAVIAGMQNRIGRFTGAIERQNAAFNRLTPSIGAAGKQVVSYAKAALLMGGISTAIGMSVREVVAYEKALASFRVIVSDLTNEGFKKFENEIQRVGIATSKSNVDVAKAFETIAGLNEEFAKSPEIIGKVAEASIILAKASGMELGSSAESVTGIMSQFSLGAEEANRVINVLAAGQGVGAASISQSAEAYKNFGAVAKGANITLEQSQGLIQTVAKYQFLGAEAGTKLRGSTLQLQKAGLGYASGQFNINNALEEAKAKMDNLKTAVEKDAYATKLFGAENITVGNILLGNISLYEDFTNRVEGTNAAQEQAALMSNTLGVKLDELKNKWVNILTSTDNSTTSLQVVKDVLGYVTANMETMIGVGGTLLALWLAWKAAIVASNVALVGYNIVLGISTALQGKSAFYVAGNTVAYAAFRTTVIASSVATKIATAAQWLWNAAMTANPIGIVIVAIGALIAIIAWLATSVDGWGEQWTEIWEFAKAVFMLQVKSIQYALLVFVNKFLNMVDTLVGAWYWYQNKTGQLSDDAYKKNMSQIESEKKARLSAMQVVADEMEGYTNRVMQGVDWKLKWAGDEEPMAPGTGVLATNPYDAQKSNMIQSFTQVTKTNEVKIKVEADNSTVNLLRNEGGIPVDIPYSIRAK